MALSGTTNFNLNLDEIVEEALLQIGGEAILGDEPRQARRTIDLLLREWQTQGYSLWKTDLDSFVPSPLATANVNGNVTNSANVVIDSNSGLIYKDMFITASETTASAVVNGTQTGTEITVDGVSGTIVNNMVVSGTGISGTTGIGPTVSSSNITSGAGTKAGQHGAYTAGGSNTATSSSAVGANGAGRSGYGGGDGGYGGGGSNIAGGTGGAPGGGGASGGYNYGGGGGSAGKVGGVGEVRMFSW